MNKTVDDFRKNGYNYDKESEGWRMYKLCKTEQSARRQRQLEDGLLAAMQNMRYEDISISDLCQQLGIPRKSFYRYFTNKEGALYGLLDHNLMEFESFREPYQPGEPRSLQRDM